MSLVHFEDFAPGQIREWGPRTVTREEIVAFASEFDPQPMHLDESAAKESILGGLAASGWHTCAIMMRMFCDGLLLNSTSQGSPGIDETKWLKPVRPGDALTVRHTVLEARPSKSRPDIGLVRHQCEVLNQRGERVMEMRFTSMFGKRSAA
jgi:acyl dehydratase